MEIGINNANIFAASASQQRSPSVDTFTARIDSARVRGHLCLRTFQAGDRFAPYGLSGRTQKLGDFWTNAGLPVKARNNWPLLCDEEAIIWIPGFRIADFYQVTDKTKEVWEFKIMKTGITPE
jgi:tRNA(Ile)-lysidine synthase